MKSTLVLLVSITVFLTAVVIVLLLTGNQGAALALAGLLVGLVLLLSFAAIWGVGSYWTRQTMAAGAEIALRAQEQDDKWDIQQSRATTDVFRAGVQAAREARGITDGGLPPLPSQSFDLPALPGYTIGEPDPDVWDISEIED